jgi:hypothetical protein
MGHPALAVKQADHPSHNSPPRVGCRLASPAKKAGCPIQAAFWLEWDTTALDVQFCPNQESWVPHFWARSLRQMWDTVVLSVRLSHCG